MLEDLSLHTREKFWAEQGLTNQLMVVVVLSLKLLPRGTRKFLVSRRYPPPLVFVLFLFLWSLGEIKLTIKIFTPLKSWCPTEKNQSSCALCVSENAGNFAPVAQFSHGFSVRMQSPATCQRCSILLEVQAWALAVLTCDHTLSHQEGVGRRYLCLLLF